MAEKFTNPYVDALFEVAGSPENVEKLLPALDEAALLLKTNDELRSCLANPKIPRQQRLEIIRAVASRAELGALGTRFLEILLGNRRLHQTGSILKAIRERLDAERRIHEAILETAHPLTGDVRARIVNVLERRTGSQIRLQSRVRPEILGGFVVRLGSYVYDASVLRQLEKVRQTFQNPS